MTSHRQSWFEGWRLFATLSLTLALLCVWIASMRQFEVDGVRMVIRSPRGPRCCSSASPFRRGTARPWPNAWTRWQRRNRRYLGVTFAASHGLHAIAIGVLPSWTRCLYGRDLGRPPTFSAASLCLHYRDGRNLVRPVSAGDRPRARRGLHLTGGYYLLFQFTLSFGKRIPTCATRCFLIPLIACSRCG